MDEDQIILDGNSPELYKPGLIAAHSSDDAGIPDVGISVGLEGESMLFAGEIPGCDGWAVVVYPKVGEKTVFLEGVNEQGAVDLVEAVAAAIRRLLQ